MHAFATLTVVLFSLSTISALPRSDAHRGGLSHRRHHARAAAAGVDLSLVRDKRDGGAYDVVGHVTKRSKSNCTKSGSTSGSGSSPTGCEEGTWQCVGQDLQQCEQSSWVTTQTCNGSTVCSATQNATACISSAGSTTASTTNDNCGDGCATSASASATPAPSSDVIGGNLWAGESSSTTKGRHQKSRSENSSSSTNWDQASPSPTGWESGGASATTGGNGQSASATRSGSQPTQSEGSSGGGSGSFSAPHYVVYADNWLSTMPSAQDVGHYNRFILAFWMTNSGAVDNAQAWEQWDDSYRQQVLDEYHNAGIALMVSAFGSTDSPTSNGADPTQTAQQLASWVKQYGLDGVDIDYEDMPAMNNNQAEDWIITFQTELRNQLPGLLISHAPVAPWFTSGNSYPSGAYVKIHQEAGNGIDFYNVQFYNQGDGVYTDCNSLINHSGGAWPSTSVMEIHSYAGVPLNNIVIGKPLLSSDASNGYIDPSTFGQCVSQAQSQGWNGGVMFWEWADQAPSLVANVLAAI